MPHNKFGFAAATAADDTTSAAVKSTPTKVNERSLNKIVSPSVQFRSGQESELSEHAQRMMAEVRGEVDRIKAELREKQKESGTSGLDLNGRLIAKPKGRAGRFSDVHMAEFKKMDSIANHPSSFRAQNAVKVTKEEQQKPAKSLKRTKSKAELDGSSSPVKNAASPNKLTKRHRKAGQADASAARPVSREEDDGGSPSKLPRSKSANLAALLTPTKASSNRAAAAKAPMTEKVSSFRSPTKAGLKTPRTELKSRFRSGLPTLGGIKSILRRHQPLYSDDPAKIAAGTHITSPSSTLNLRKDFSFNFNFGSTTPSGTLERKRVEFTPTTKSRFELAVTSPSPSKIAAPHFKPDAARATNSDGEVKYPHIPMDVDYPVLPNKENLTVSKSSPSKTAITNQALLNRLASPTIRRVRPSSSSASIRSAAPISFADTSLPAYAHGLSNKKRHRAVADDGEEERDEDSKNDKVKRARTDGNGNANGSANLEKKLPPTPASARVNRVARGKMTLSRLNMLARPKDRR